MIWGHWTCHWCGREEVTYVQHRQRLVLDNFLLPCLVSSVHAIDLQVDNFHAVSHPYVLSSVLTPVIEPPLFPCLLNVGTVSGHPPLPSLVPHSLCIVQEARILYACNLPLWLY